MDAPTPRDLTWARAKVHAITNDPEFLIALLEHLLTLRRANIESEQQLRRLNKRIDKED